MDMYVYINVDRDAGIEISYCNYRHLHIHAKHSKSKFECQPDKICTEIHGFQTVLSYVRTARRLNQPVDKKSHSGT